MLLTECWGWFFLELAMVVDAEARSGGVGGWTKVATWMVVGWMVEWLLAVVLMSGRLCWLCTWSPSQWLWWAVWAVWCPQWWWWWSWSFLGVPVAVGCLLVSVDFSAAVVMMPPVMMMMMGWWWWWWWSWSWSWQWQWRQWWWWWWWWCHQQYKRLEFWSKAPARMYQGEWWTYYHQWPED